MQERTILSIIGAQNTVTLQPGTTVRAAAKVMAQHRIGAVPVTEKGRLVGIFTERDLMNRVIAGDIDEDATRLGDVMTAEPQTIAADATIVDALHLMIDGGFRHLPVVQGERLVGIVSMRDIPPEYWGLREAPRAVNG